MKKQNANIWVGKKDLERDAEFLKETQAEFAETNLLEDLGDEKTANGIGGNRRDFLKFLGFGLGAATVAAGCDIPVKRAIPYVVKPDSIIPGVATYYASAYVKGGDYCPVLVKTREGRPIKIEGNQLSSFSQGGTSAKAQASVIELYDVSRYNMPKISDEVGNWEDSSWFLIDDKIKSALKSARGVRVVTNTILSPTAKKALAEFTAKYNAEVVTYDPVSSGAILEANELTFGDRAIPNYSFDKAQVVASFGADFLGTWISPTEFTNDWIKNRVIKDVNHPKMSRLIQIETGMSLTGSNADNRILVKPSEQGAAIAYLANKIVGGVSVPALNAKAKKNLDRLASELQNARGKSLVISDSNNVAEQILVNAINSALGNYGNTLSFANASLQRQGSEKSLAKLESDLKSGRVDVVIFNDCNPAYDAYNRASLVSLLEKVKTKVSIGLTPNETSELCNIIAPKPHVLESWGDVEAKRGQYAVIQPTIQPLFDTRQAEESFLSWSDSPNLNKKADQPYFEYLKSAWKAGPFANQSKFTSFTFFWDQFLRDGVLETESAGSGVTFSGDVAAAAARVTKPSNSELEIAFFESFSLGNGEYAGNPWLQELADPVTRTSWGNYLAVPVNFDGVRSFVGLNDLNDGELVKLTVGDKEMTVPVIQQFGQMPGTVSLALGNGRSIAGRTGSDVGVDVNHGLTRKDGYVQYFNPSVSVSKKVGKEKHYSSVQYHHTYGLQGEEKSTGETINADEAALVFFDYFTGTKGFQGSLTDRSVVYTTTRKDLKDKLEHLHKKREFAQHLNEQQYYDGHDAMYERGHHWGMHIDLNACTGCGACVISCNAENNVPIVGKQEVSRHHEMTWLRIDRYYYGDVANPNAVYQPMMCQHCDNAPCENVCPVNATNHSSEGLNQMTYNRCIGTRYCANNCPYKVRRFNWLDYTTADLFPANQPSVGNEGYQFGTDDLTRMVLNPDVTVRSRGVIEKCSFCVQRIQEGKLQAKVEGRKLRDGDVKPACESSCPTGGIVFGDLNDPNSEVSKLSKNPLNYIALEEVNVRSSVTYTMKVNNKDTSYEA